jgi:hypothetical protein
MAGTLRRMADRHDREAAAEQRVGGIGYFDLIGRRISWVLEQGSLLLSQSMP